MHPKLEKQFRKRALELGNSGDPSALPTSKISIMISGLEEIDAVVADEVNEAVFLGEAAGTDAGGKILERFRFADTAEGIAYDGLDKIEGTQRHLAVGLDPVAEVVVEFRLENGHTPFTSQDRFPLAAFSRRTACPRV